MESALEINGVTVPFTWNGLTVGTIPDGAPLYMSDPILPSAFGLTKFTDGTQIFMRTGIEVAVGAGFPFNTNYDKGLVVAGESALYMASGTPSLVNATGPLPAGDAASGAGPYYSSLNLRLPVAIIGTPLTKKKAWIGIGDSIMAAVADAHGDPVFGCDGWFPRTMIRMPSPPPYVKVGASGSRVEQLGTTKAAILASKRAVLFQYCDVMTSEYSGNSCTPGSDPAPIYAAMKNLWSAARDFGSTSFRRATRRVQNRRTAISRLTRTTQTGTSTIRRRARPSRSAPQPSSSWL